MNQELQGILFERYPAIFIEKNLSRYESAMYQGIECGDGWFTLIDTLCRRLQKETDQSETPQIVVTQIKEKLGRLRFRTRTASERQRAMIELAEALSECTCEICGAPANLEYVDFQRGIQCNRCIAKSTQQLFMHWYTENRSRFSAPINFGNPYAENLSFNFVGITNALQANISSNGIQIDVFWNGSYVDILRGNDFNPSHRDGGYICKLCADAGYHKTFPSLDALRIEHEFESLLAWINDDLAKATVLGVWIEEGSHSTAKLFDTEFSCLQDFGGKGFVVPLRTSQP